MQTAYSYIRFSSKGQADGNSVERQLKKAKEICAEREWVLDASSFQDLGCSAFRGKNWDAKSALGQFLEAVRGGRTTPNPILIIESLDRFSRQSIDEVLPVWLTILKSGIRIYSCLDGVLYDKESAGDLGKVMLALVTFYRAWEESRTKSIRIKSAKSKRFQRIDNGEKFRCDDLAPCWLDWDGSRYIPNPKADIVKEIFHLYLEGKSLQGIAKVLNDRKSYSFYCNTLWSQQTVRKILDSRMVVGEYRGQKDYFPKIVDDDSFAKVQMNLQRFTTRRGRKSDFIHILKGMVFCKECGSPLALHTAKEVKHRYLRCCTPYRGGCSQRRMIQLPLVEECLFAIVLAKTPEELASGKVDDTDYLKQMLGENEKKISKVMGMLDSLEMDELKSKLVELNEEKKSLQERLGKVVPVVPPAVDKIKELVGMDDWWNLDAVLGKLVEDLKQPEVRKQLLPVMPSLFSKMEVDLNRGDLYVNAGGKVLYHSIA